MAENKRDYYEVLGVSKDADEDTLKKHTENLPRNTILMQILVTRRQRQSLRKFPEAYSVLSDPQKRQQYDQFGHAAFEQGGGAGYGGGFGGFDFNGGDMRYLWRYFR